LIGIDWGADWAAHRTHPGDGNVTACSPCAVQAVVMAFASAEQRASFDADRFLHDADYRAGTCFATDAPVLFNTAAQSNLHPGTHQPEVNLANAHGYDIHPSTANGWVASVVAFGFGVEHDLVDAKRGDCIHITWDGTGGTHAGGEHAGFIWDVHYNAQGRADAVLVVAANGSPGPQPFPPGGGGHGDGFSVLGNPGNLVTHSGPDTSLRYSAPEPYFDESRAATFVTHGTWLTWPGSDPVDHSPSAWRHTPPRNFRTTQRLRIARLNGVEGAPSLSTPDHGAAAAPPPPHVESVTPVEVEQSALSASPTQTAASTRTDAQQSASTSTRRQRSVEHWLRVLHRHHWLDADPGDADDVNDARTQAAIREFQRRYMNDPSPDGIAGRLTRPRLQECASQAASGQPPPDAPPAPATTPSIGRFYWATPSARANTTARLLARTDGLDGHTLHVALRNQATGASLGEPRTMSIANGRGETSIALAPLYSGTGTLLLEARASDSGVAEVVTEALRVEPPLVVIAPTGKGIFANRNGHTAEAAATMHGDGLQWVAICVRDTDGVNSSQSHVTAAVQVYRDVGIEPWLWGWPGKPHPGNESAVIDQIAELAQTSHARGFILDMEGEYTAAEQHALFPTIRARVQHVLDGGLLGVGISSFLESVMLGMAVDGAFTSPQWYHPTVFDDDQDELSAKMRRLADRCGKVVPTVAVYEINPNYPTNNTPNPIPLTPEALRPFLDRLNVAAALPEASGKVPASSAWVWTSHLHGDGPNAALYRVYQQWSFTGT
ncbi:MAG TPA: peptidoglycan-binding domain-containing protein, partial [Polyangia bacterium]|nr:peptidoglycan-binding domain-containing protein [Polyangia bacterium]